LDPGKRQTTEQSKQIGKEKKKKQLLSTSEEAKSTSADEQVVRREVEEGTRANANQVIDQTRHRSERTMNHGLQICKWSILAVRSRRDNSGTAVLFQAVKQRLEAG
jgi:hypothetical protein